MARDISRSVPLFFLLLAERSQIKYSQIPYTFGDAAPAVQKAGPATTIPSSWRICLSRCN